MSEEGGLSYKGWGIIRDDMEIIDIPTSVSEKTKPNEGSDFYRCFLYAGSKLEFLIDLENAKKTRKVKKISAFIDQIEWGEYGALFSLKGYDKVFKMVGSSQFQFEHYKTKKIKVLIIPDFGKEDLFAFEVYPK